MPTLKLVVARVFQCMAHLLRLNSHLQSHTASDYMTSSPLCALASDSLHSHALDQDNSDGLDAFMGACTFLCTFLFTTDVFQDANTDYMVAMTDRLSGDSVEPRWPGHRPVRLQHLDALSIH